MSRKDWLGDLRVAAVTSTRRLLRRSNVALWSAESSYRDQWELRLRELVRPIPAGATVVDLGAGLQALRGMLPPGSQYVPVDLVPRTADTLVCDFNSSAEFPSICGDWAVASGVLEYVVKANRLLQWMCISFDHVALSYVVMENKYQSRLVRRKLGWVNDFRRDQLSSLIVRSGFSIVDQQDFGDQVLFWLRSGA